MPEPLIENDDGWDFKVLILDGEWVLRIARNDAAAEKLAKEADLLPGLASVLPVEIPRFEHVFDEPQFVVYRLIRGEPLREEDPDGVRAFLQALHSLEPRGLPIPPPEDWVAAWRGETAKFRRRVLPLLDIDERPDGEALLQEVETLTGFRPSLIHSDLEACHLLVREERLVGVIDWAGARIGDPALDYAWLLNGPFPDWDVDEELRRRASLYFRFGPWFAVEYGLRTDQPEWVRSGLENLRSRL
jgi:aminoglycoside 2''-phosphotransferase